LVRARCRRLHAQLPLLACVIAIIAMVGEAHQSPGNLSLGLLTALAGAGLVLTVAGLIASVVLPQSSLEQP